MHVTNYLIEFRQHSTPEGRERVACALRLLLTQTREPLVESTRATCPGLQHKAETGRTAMTPEEEIST